MEQIRFVYIRRTLQIWQHWRQWPWNENQPLPFGMATPKQPCFVVSKARRVFFVTLLICCISTWSNWRVCFVFWPNRSFALSLRVNVFDPGLIWWSRCNILDREWIAWVCPLFATFFLCVFLLNQAKWTVSLMTDPFIVR